MARRFPKLDEENAKCLVNSTYNPDAEEWTMKKALHKDLVPKVFGAKKR